MAKTKNREYIEKAAGEKEQFSLNIRNWAVEPERKSTKVEKIVKKI